MVRNDEIMTIKDLSSYLKINKKTIYKLAKLGKLPGVKIRRDYLNVRLIDSTLNASFSNSLNSVSLNTSFSTRSTNTT
ncbi:MAG: helix-turn-helix domain-containing protein [bacterium]